MVYRSLTTTESLDRQLNGRSREFGNLLRILFHIPLYVYHLVFDCISISLVAR